VCAWGSRSLTIPTGWSLWARPKFFEWEAKGVPLRAELGPRDLAEGVVTLARRDREGRTTVARADAASRVRDVLLEIQRDMYEHAARDLREHVVDIAANEEVREMINRIGWCGDEACGKQVETDTGMSLLGTPFPPEPFEGKCISCGRPAVTAAYVARTY